MNKIIDLDLKKKFFGQKTRKIIVKLAQRFDHFCFCFPFKLKGFLLNNEPKSELDRKGTSV